MKNLKIEELKEGEFYKCRLSNRVVLVTQVTSKEYQKRAYCVSYSEITGQYFHFESADYQLQELEK